MKLFLISANYPPARCGMADYADRLRTYFLKGGKVVPYVITVRASGIATKGKPHVYRMMSAWGARDNQRLLKFIKKESPDVVHLQYHNEDFPYKSEITELPFLIKKYFPGIKTVVSLAGFDLINPEGLRNAKRLAAHSDALIVTTDPDLRLVLDKLPGVENKIFKIYDRPNIIREPGLKIKKGRIRAKFNISEKDFLLINFGFINQNKGFEQIFRSLRLVLDEGFPAKLLVVGELHDGRHGTLGRYYLKLKGLVKELRLKDNVIWAGYAPDNIVSGYILSADAAAMPFRDGISGKRSSFWSVLEHGIPAITTFSQKKDIPEKLKHGVNSVLVAVDDHEALADGIIQLIKDGKLRRRLGKNGRKLVKEKYSWEMLVGELEKIYRG